MKRAVVLGAGGFIGSHMVNRLKKEGFFVVGADLKKPDFSDTQADVFIVGDLRDPELVAKVIGPDIDELYQFAADMGGAGYIFTGEHDADVMHNSALVNLNVAHECVVKKVKKVFYSSSACIYPEYNQLDPDNPNCTEASAYPAAPDSEYGWEKLFSERLYFAFNRNYNLDVRVARYHNIFGPQGTYDGGREKAPAAMCRKAAEGKKEIEVWGSGNQTRSFMYVDECVEATLRLMRQDKFLGPVNIGSEEMVTINELAEIAIELSGNDLSIKNIDGQEFIDKYGFPCPLGVNGRNSHNKLYRENLGWESKATLKEGMAKTFKWIKKQIK